MATNYYERIDSAIRRQGRFDERLLLSLPDTSRRREFLWEFLEKKLGDTPPRNLKTGEPGRKAFEKARALPELLKETVLFGYGDLKYLVKLLKIDAKNDTWKSVVEKLRIACDSVQPSVKLGAYVSRLEESAPREERASEEFALLLYLMGEGGSHIDDDQRKIIEAGYAKGATADDVVKHLQGSMNVKTAAKTQIEKALPKPSAGR
jgi:hypothetical protein